jgi:MFS family permease
MKRKKLKHLEGQKSLSSLSVRANPIFGYSGVIFLVAMADAIMSYTTPVFIQEVVKDPFMTGVIIALSSVIGFWADVWVGNKFGHKKYNFFLFWTIIFGIFFPLSLFLLPPIFSVFVLSMVVWGVYFELMEFSNFHFIHEHQPSSSHAESWGLLYTFKSAAYFVGPLLAGYLIVTNIRLPFVVSAFFFGFSLLGLMVFQKKTAKKQNNKADPDTHHETKRSALAEMRIWKSLFSKVWPVWLFTLAIFMIDAMFWTTGALFSEELKMTHPLGGWVISVYILPSLFGGLLAKKAALNLGKKRAAFLAGITNGILMIIAGFVTNVPLLLTLIFLASFFVAIAMPEILAVSEDYVSRLDEFGNDMVGLERSAVSMAYVIGPILAGWVSVMIGYQKVFSVVGGILLVISLIVFWMTPRKIRMPQQELQTIES